MYNIIIIIVPRCNFTPKTVVVVVVVGTSWYDLQTLRRLVLRRVGARVAQYYDCTRPRDVLRVHLHNLLVHVVCVVTINIDKRCTPYIANEKSVGHNDRTLVPSSVRAVLRRCVYECHRVLSASYVLCTRERSQSSAIPVTSSSNCPPFCVPLEMRCHEGYRRRRTKWLGTYDHGDV